MKKVKSLKGWGIYKNNPKEVIEYGFHFTVLTPDNMEYSYTCSPADSDMEEVIYNYLISPLIL